LVVVIVALGFTLLSQPATGARQPTAGQQPKSKDTAGGKASRDWKVAQSANFIATGDASEGTLRSVLTELEAFRWAFLQMFSSIDLSSPVPMTVVVFRDWDSFTRFQPRDEKGKRQDTVAGYFMITPNVNYMVMGAQGTGSDFARQVVFHEFTHYILHRNLHDIPIWLDEGLSDYYSTLKIDKNEIVIGRADRDYLGLLREVSLLPLEKMLSTQATVKLFKDERDRARFYAQSWALVHYLTLGGQGKRQKQMGAYVDALQRGLSIEQAFQTAFACTYDELEHELSSYIHKYQFPAIALTVPVSLTEKVGPAQAMSDADAEALQADLLVRVGAREDAEKKLTALLAREPGMAAARLSLALLRLQQDRRGEAVEILRALAQADSNDFAAHVYLAPVLIELGQSEEAMRAAERAAALNQASPAAWSALALAALVADRDSQADAAMGRLQQVDPDPGYYQSRAYSAFRLGKDAAASRDAYAFVKRAGWGHESAPYMAFLAALCHRRLGQAADADRVLEQARLVVERGSWTEKVLDYFQGKLPADKFLLAAKEDGEKTEAHTYIGFHDALAGRRDQAIAHFRWVKERGARTYYEYRLAVAELERLEKPASAPQAPGGAPCPVAFETRNAGGLPG
jgi:tetratricopeptide (TPR) repeat protein